MKKKIVLLSMMFMICLFSFWNQITFASDETTVEHHKEETIDDYESGVTEEQEKKEYDILMWSEDAKTTLLRLLTNLHKNINKEHPEFALCENPQWNTELTNNSIEKLKYQFENYISKGGFEENAYENVFPYENQEMIVMGADNKGNTSDQLYVFLENLLSGNYENKDTVKIIKDFLEIEEIGAAYNVFSVENKYGVHELISYKKRIINRDETIEQELYNYITTELLNNKENIQTLLQNPVESTDTENSESNVEDPSVSEKQDNDINGQEEYTHSPEESEIVIEQGKSHWITDGYGKKYCYADGSFAKGYTLIDGYYYFFNQNGYMQVGHVVVDGQAYQFWHEAGYGRSKGWVNYPDGKKAYCLGDGKLAIGYTKIENKYYYFGNDGCMQTGHVVADGQAYQFWHEAGYGRPKGWVNYPDGKKAYCLGDGKLAMGYTKIENRYYYFGNDGCMQVGHVIADGQAYQFWHEAGYGRPKGWIDYSDGKKAYCEGNGKLAIGGRIIDGTYYRFNKEGYLMTNNKWITDGTGKKYVYEDGSLATGYMIIDGQYYYFNQNGYMQVGHVVVDGQAYQFWHEAGYGRPKGWINYPDGKKAYCLGNGKLAMGYTKIENKYYYFGNDGCMQVGHVVVDGQAYQFWYEEGYGRPAGWINYPGGKKAYCMGNGILAKGYTKIENKFYYFGNDGCMQVGHVVADGQAYQFWCEAGYGRPVGWINYPDGKKAYCLGNGKLAIGQLKIGKSIYYFDSEGYLIKTEKRGIDVSEFQGKIDWRAVKKSGIEFAFIRVGGRYGLSGKFYEDKQYHNNMKGAAQNDIDTGIYFFTQAINEAEAIQEARFACSRLKGYDIKFPVVIDTESLEGCRHNNLTVQQRTNVVKAFCEEVIRQGYKPMIYSGLYWLQDNLDMSQLTKYDVWVAQYNLTCDYKGKYSCWQYTSKGSVPGIKGNVDMNIWYYNK